MKRWDQLVDQFLDELEARRVGEGSRQGYRSELSRLKAWLWRRRPRPKLEEVDQDRITAYLKGRSSFLAKSTISSVMSRIRVFGDFLVREGVWAENPMRWLTGPRLNWSQQVPRRIRKRDLEKLLAEAAAHPHKYFRKLWFTVIVLFYATGMRRGEMERLDLSDWDSEAGTLRVDGRKTGTERVLPVADIVTDCIESYLPFRQNQLARWEIAEAEALFINRDGNRLEGGQIGSAVHRLARQAEVPLKTLHQFRHTCASDLLAEGMTVSEVQHLLGHAAVDSTMRYIHVAAPERKEAVAAHPINGMLQRNGEVEHV